MGGWLILAPHPDDETLGAGGLIAALSAVGGDVMVAFLTDGAASHVGAPDWSRRRIGRVRAAEARAALRQLGSIDPPLHLGWPDATPAVVASPEWERTVRRLVALCRRRRLRRIVASWSADPHCDHAAAAALARAVGRQARVDVCYYAVWGWTRDDLAARLAGVGARAVPVGRWRGRARRALDRHATQLGGRIAGAAERFVLPRSMRRLVDVPHALLLEERNAA